MRSRRVLSGRVSWVVLSALLAVVVSVGVSVPGYGSEGGEVGPVEDGGVHQPAIDALRQHYPGLFDGTGCDGGLCAGEPLLRWEMAVWLVRVLDGADPPTEQITETATRFADVDDGVWWAPHAYLLDQLGVTGGCATGPLRFCPTSAVTRGQMASFLVRAFNLGGIGWTDFVDTSGNTHEASIQNLAVAGVTTGCRTGPPRFCPDRSVTRGQMATFLVRALGLLSAQEPPTQALAVPFSDVPSDHPDVRGVIRLREAGVLEGTECGDSNDGFCPDQAIDRKTFAVWVVRVLDGTNAPTFAKGSASGTSGGAARFVDVPESHPEHDFVERLAEVGVASACSVQPLRFCPDGTIPRDEMATFLDRAFGFPEVDMEGFVDVDDDSSYSNSIRKVWAAGVDDGCTVAGPLHFCPHDVVTRGQMATLLVRAIDWQETNKALEPTGSDNSVRLTATFDDSLEAATIRWYQTGIDPDQVSHYVVQWRDPWGAFGAKNHMIVEVNQDKNASYQVIVSTKTPSGPYAVRVITFYDDGRRLEERRGQGSIQHPQATGPDRRRIDRPPSGRPALVARHLEICQQPEF